MSRPWVLARLAVALGAAGWWAADRAVLWSGARIYADSCAECHGANLEGAPLWMERHQDGTLPAPPHDAQGHTWHHDDDTLFTVTKLGPQAILGADYRTDMPAFSEQLSDRQIRAVLAYIKSTWPQEQREYQELMNRPAAERLFQPGAAN